MFRSVTIEGSSTNIAWLDILEVSRNKYLRLLFITIFCLLLRNSAYVFSELILKLSEEFEIMFST